MDSEKLLGVSQRSRDFAAMRLERQSSGFPGHPSRHTASMVRDGKMDCHEWVQEFARFERDLAPENGLREALERIASGEAFRCQRFAEDDDAEYFLRAQRAVVAGARLALSQAPR